MMRPTKSMKSYTNRRIDTWAATRSTKKQVQKAASFMTKRNLAKKPFGSKKVKF